MMKRSLRSGSPRTPGTPSSQTRAKRSERALRSGSPRTPGTPSSQTRAKRSVRALHKDFADMGAVPRRSPRKRLLPDEECSPAKRLRSSPAKTTKLDSEDATTAVAIKTFYNSGKAKYISPLERAANKSVASPLISADVGNYFDSETLNGRKRQKKDSKAAAPILTRNVKINRSSGKENGPRKRSRPSVAGRGKKVLATIPAGSSRSPIKNMKVETSSTASPAKTNCSPRKTKKFFKSRPAPGKGMLGSSVTMQKGKLTFQGRTPDVIKKKEAKAAKQQVKKPLAFVKPVKRNENSLKAIKDKSKESIRVKNEKLSTYKPDNVTAKDNTSVVLENRCMDTAKDNTSVVLENRRMDTAKDNTSVVLENRCMDKASEVISKVSDVSGVRQDSVAESALKSSNPYSQELFSSQESSNSVNFDTENSAEMMDNHEVNCSLQSLESKTVTGAKDICNNLVKDQKEDTECCDDGKQSIDSGITSSGCAVQETQTAKKLCEDDNLSEGSNVSSMVLLMSESSRSSDTSNTTSAETSASIAPSKRFFPIFTPPGTPSSTASLSQRFSNSPGTPSSNRAPGSSKRSPKLLKKMVDKEGREQMILDFGQKIIGATQCQSCGMTYTPGEPTDDATHGKFHQRILAALKFPGWKKERVLQEFPDGSRIVVVQPGEKQYMKKVDAVRAIVDEDLGFVVSSQSVMSKSKTFLYISEDKRVVGCCIAEAISQAYRVIGEPETKSTQNGETTAQKPWCCSTEPEKAKCGINRIWVLGGQRRSGIASKLLDCVRFHFLLGFPLAAKDLAFTDPTPSGRLFATRYTGTPSFLVYKHSESSS